jgi:chromosome partitioning protein
MAAEVIAVCNQKGGSGKSTIAMHLAAALHALGHRVLVVDADPQNTLVRWSSSATEHPLPLQVISLAAAGNKIHREVAKYVPDHEYIGPCQLIERLVSRSSGVPYSAHEHTIYDPL